MPRHDDVALSTSVAGPAGGVPVILLASLGRPASDFELLAGSLVEAGYRTVGVDLPGIGSSPPLDEGATLHDVAGAVAVVAEGCGSSVHVVGHAYGNRVARCLAADRPELVRSLVLLGCGGKIPPDEEAAAALLRCFGPTMGDAEHLAAVATAFFAPGHDPSIWRDGWHADAARLHGAATRSTPIEDWWVPAASIPVLALVGLDDRISVPANARDLVRQHAGRHRLVEIPDAGHALLPEQPEAVAAAVVDFLGWVDE